MSSSDLFRMELNGVPVQVEDLKTLWLSNYGHFTVLPVKNAKVRGLSLHMGRLQQNTQILYGCGIDTARVLAFVRHAIDVTTEPLSVRVNVFSRSGLSKIIVEPDILITVSSMPDEALMPLRVQSTQYERDLPQVKHVGTFGRNYRYRLAQLNGFDDILFTDASGSISEGSSWNVGLFDGQRIVWPSAPVLPGIAMQLIQAGLKKNGIPFEVREVRLQDLPTFRSAFCTNVLVGAQAIASIDDVTFFINTELNAMLKQCYEANPEEEI
jgi:4-amino-4-deoxychorismate lyase